MRGWKAGLACSCEDAAAHLIPLLDDSLASFIQVKRAVCTLWSFKEVCFFSKVIFLNLLIYFEKKSESAQVG